jgi:2-dehydro-3-deoxy-D-arabinonate dehydratase
VTAPVKLLRTHAGWMLDSGHGHFRLSAEQAHDLTMREDLHTYLTGLVGTLPAASDADLRSPLPPIDRQEVWAAGVTYFRSRDARMEESKSSGGGQFYDLVYHAERPEIFFKAAPWRVVGSGAPVRIRRDAHWNVPEPEFVLLISPTGRILGYTAGNDMSSRDIEGENPLYLPQAKVYDGACAIGPAILVTPEPLAKTTQIAIEIRRAGDVEFAGATTVAGMKRDFETLVSYLYRELSFPHGCLLFTGTGVIPPDSFTLRAGDEIGITIEGIGTLRNTVD